jgi:hypothetical protein
MKSLKLITIAAITLIASGFVINALHVAQVNKETQARQLLAQEIVKAQTAQKAKEAAIQLKAAQEVQKQEQKIELNKLQHQVDVIAAIAECFEHNATYDHSTDLETERARKQQMLADLQANYADNVDFIENVKYGLENIDFCYQASLYYPKPL